MSLKDKGLEIGSVAPLWQLRAVDGRRFGQAEYRGRVLLLFFFRGTWCPNCRKQMESVAAEWKRIEPLAAVVGIVGQDSRTTEDFLARNPLPFPLLPDPDREVVKQFGVFQRLSLEGFRIAYPSTLIIDEEGIVRYCYVGESQFDRPDLRQIISELGVLRSRV